MSITRTSAALALAAGLVLTGCSGDADPSAEDSRSTGPSTQASEAPQDNATPELVDRSEVVLDYEVDTTPVASAAGTWGATPDVTLSVYAVETTAATTRLVFNLRSASGSQLNPITPDSWELFPTLVDPAGEQTYRVNTFQRPDRPSRTGVYFQQNGLATAFSPGTAQFPPLPEGVDSVDVVTPEFEAITVPVTRS